MNCPSCKNINLKATRLDAGLPALACEQCSGAMISLLYYRDWAERMAHIEFEHPSEFDAEYVADKDSKTALHCPKCSRLMTKYKISGCNHNRLDLCDSCDEAWLDGGEWELLKALQLSKNIPKIFTDVWQKKINQELSDQKLKQRFAHIIGQADIHKVETFRNWLIQHEKRAEILLYISQK